MMNKYIENNKFVNVLFEATDNVMLSVEFCTLLAAFLEDFFKTKKQKNTYYYFQTKNNKIFLILFDKQKAAIGCYYHNKTTYKYLNKVLTELDCDLIF